MRLSWIGSFVAIAFAGNASALCGDVSGDGQQTATDALMRPRRTAPTRAAMGK